MRKTVLSTLVPLGLGLSALAWLAVTRALRSDAPVDALALPAAEATERAPRPEPAVGPGAVVPLTSSPREPSPEREAPGPGRPARSAPVVPPGLVGEAFDAPAPEVEAGPEVGPSQSFVTGRVVAANGAAIRGASAELVGSRPRSTSRDSGGRWTYAVSQEVACDADGRFRLLVPLRRGMRWELALAAPRHGTEYVRLGSLEGGARTELGDFELALGARVHGRCVDRHGNPRGLDGNGRIVVRGLRFPRDHVGFREVGEVRLGSGGRFTVDDLPAGPITIEVLRGGSRGRRVAFAFFEIEAGTEVRVDVPAVEHEGARLWVETRVAHGLAAWPDPARVLARGERGGERRAAFEAGAYVFDGLVDPEVDVRIADDRFRTWERLGVDADDGFVTATLEGTSRLAVSARDARTGAVLSGVRLKLRPAGTDALHGVWITGERGRDATLHRGIPGGDWIATVHVPGYGAEDVLVRDLAPGEERTVVARLSSGVAVAGRVRFPAEVPGPLGRAARVALFASEPRGPVGPLRVGDDPASRRAFHDALAERRIHTVRPVDADEDGAFTLAGVLPGRHLVAADLGRGCLAVRRVVVGHDDVDGVDLELPLARRLVGRFDVPRTYDATRFVVTGTSRSDPEAQPVRVGLDARGSFASAPLPPGPARVRLGHEPYPSALRGDALRLPSGTSIALDDVDVPVNADAEIAFAELAERLPARLEVACDVRGDEAPLVVEALAPLDRTVGDGARLAADGRAELALFAGRYDVRVRALDGSWCRWAPEPVELADGERSEVALAVELVRADVRFVDDAGRALAMRELHWWRPGDDPGFSARGRTDAEGRLTLTLPPGDVHFALAVPGEESAAGGTGEAPAGARAVVRWGAREPGRGAIVLDPLTER